MNWFKKTAHNAFAGSGLDIPAAIAADQLELVLIEGAVPDMSMTGHEFWSDLVAAGATINSTLVLNAAVGASWVAGILDANSALTIIDPGSGASTWAVLRINTGTPATSRLLGADDIADLTHDGTDDTIDVNAGGLLTLGFS